MQAAQRSLRRCRWAPPGMTVAAGASPVRLGVGITGHRGDHPALATGSARIGAGIAQVFALIESILASERAGPPGRSIHATRLHSMLAHGVDQLAASTANALGWEVVAPLPFGKALNTAINAQPHAFADGAALLAGADAGDAQVQARAQGIRDWYERAHLFELADRDADIAAWFEAALAAPDDRRQRERFHAAASSQAALAGRVMIEQSDLVVAVWDGATRDHAGGTGNTVMRALEAGTPVLLIDPASPEQWTLLTSTECLADRQGNAGNDVETLRAIIGNALWPCAGDKAVDHTRDERWHPRGSHVSTLYRRVEALFGNEPRRFRSLVQDYESPDDCAAGSGAALVKAASELPGGDARFADAIANGILPSFVRADGISARLSDAYRSGMTANFILSALAVMIGAAYLPLGASDSKWFFALGEFVLLVAILAVTWLGSRHRLHARWFETRRAAEYLRHAPILLLVGVARPPNRWPRGNGGGSAWPEYAARHALRAPGLPAAAMTPAYLRAALANLLAPHVAAQRAYHQAKAVRLDTVHRRLDGMAVALFKLAVVSVSVYLLLKAGAALQLLPAAWPEHSAKAFTFLGIALPTLASSIAGIRYFGDFERFSTISQMTAGRLGQVEARIDRCLAGPDSAIDYESISRLAREIDEVVVAEIESWQAVFSGKHIGLPA